jgi:hypothetical protein
MKVVGDGTLPNCQSNGVFFRLTDIENIVIVTFLVHLGVKRTQALPECIEKSFAEISSLCYSVVRGCLRMGVGRT